MLHLAARNHSNLHFEKLGKVGADVGAAIQVGIENGISNVLKGGCDALAQEALHERQILPVPRGITDLRK